MRIRLPAGDRSFAASSQVRSGSSDAKMLTSCASQRCASVRSTCCLIDAICEGCIDTLSALQLGLPAVGVPGVTGFQRGWFDRSQWLLVQISQVCRIRHGGSIRDYGSSLGNFLLFRLRRSGGLPLTTKEHPRHQHEPGHFREPCDSDFHINLPFRHVGAWPVVISYPHKKSNLSYRLGKQ